MPDQFVPDRGLAVHERLYPREVLRRSALHQVAGHGEGTAGEPDERHLERVGEDGDRVDDIRRVGRRIERPEALEVLLGPEGLGHHRSGPRGHVDTEPDGRHRHDDVGEEDGGVGAVAVDRLPGELGDQLGPGDGVEDAAGPAGGPVLGEGPAGLTHEPHRHTVHAEAAAGPHEGGVVESPRRDRTHSSPRARPQRAAAVVPDREVPRPPGTAARYAHAVTADSSMSRVYESRVARRRRRPGTVSRPGAYNRGFP